MPYEDITDCIGSQGNQARGTNRGSAASSLKASPSPTSVMLRAWPIAKHQLRHDPQLDEHGRQVATLEVKEHTLCVQCTLEDLRDLAKQF
jgi:hypothetical protein